MKAQREIEVINRHGLHARPAMQVVDVANRYASDITLLKVHPEPGREPVDAKSVMQVITLAATRGTRLRLDADGPDAEQAADEIACLFASRFGEDE